jgi:hypothetical protein
MVREGYTEAREKKVQVQLELDLPIGIIAELR